MIKRMTALPILAGISGLLAGAFIGWNRGPESPVELAEVTDEPAAIGKALS